jgi:hypothetical protein
MIDILPIPRNCAHLVSGDFQTKKQLFFWEEKLVAPLIATPNGEVRK